MAPAVVLTQPAVWHLSSMASPQRLATCPATQETQVLQVNSYPLQVDFTDSRNPSFPEGGSLHKGKG